MTWAHDDRYVAPARERPETAGAHIRLHRVYKVHHIGDTGVVALAGVDVEIPPGEFVAVVGPSGTGKSTILHLLGGLDQASAGIVEIDGQDLALLTDVERTRFLTRAGNVVGVSRDVRDAPMPELDQIFRHFRGRGEIVDADVERVFVELAHRDGDDRRVRIRKLGQDRHAIPTRAAAGSRLRHRRLRSGGRPAPGRPHLRLRMPRSRGDIRPGAPRPGHRRGTG